MGSVVIRQSTPELWWKIGGSLGPTARWTPTSARGCAYWAAHRSPHHEVTFLPVSYAFPGIRHTQGSSTLECRSRSIG